MYRFPNTSLISVPKFAYSLATSSPLPLLLRLRSHNKVKILSSRAPQFGVAWATPTSSPPIAPKMSARPPSSSAPPAKRPRLSPRLSLPPPPPSLLSLPESALVHIFDLSSPPLCDDTWSRKRALGFIFRTPGVALPRPEYVATLAVREPFFGYLRGDDDEDASPATGALALAAASPVLADIFRRACVSTVVITNAAAAAGAAVADAFARFSGADSLVISYPVSVRGVTPLALEALLSGAVVQNVTRLVLRRVALGIGDVDEIARAFPRIEQLILLKCAFSDNDLTLISFVLGSRLRKMRLFGVKNHRTHLSTDGLRVTNLGDAGGHSLRRMSALQVLCVDRQSRFTSCTFKQFAALRQLRTLNVDSTEFCDDDTKALTDLVNLQNLSVASCVLLTHGMLAFLPENLETLNISQTAVLSRETPDAIFVSSPPVVAQNFITLQADQVTLSDWLPLVGLVSLRQIYMRKCTVTAKSAKAAFESWPLIRRVDLSGCILFGNGRSRRDPQFPHNNAGQVENRLGDVAIEALIYAACNVKELRVDSTDITCYQWIRIATQVLAQAPACCVGEQRCALMVLTITDPMTGLAEMDWATKQVAISVVGLLVKAFGRATLRIKPPPVKRRDPRGVFIAGM